MIIAVPEKTNGQRLAPKPVNDSVVVAAPRLLPNSKQIVMKYEEIPTRKASHRPYFSETTVRMDFFDMIPKREAMIVYMAIEMIATINIHSRRQL